MCSGKAIRMLKESDHPVLVRYAREMMKKELRRYDTTDVHVTLEEPPEQLRGEHFDGIELRMSRIGPGMGIDAPYDFAVWRIPTHLIDERKIGAILREGVEKMCAKLFGVHEGSGLP